MHIVPISSMAMLQESPVRAAQSPAGDVPFKNVLQQALSNIEETQAVKDQDSINLALGEVDDLAQIQINSLKADMAITTMITLRDRVLDAYTEIMRMNV